MRPQLSILIATIGRRSEKFLELVGKLLEQEKDFPIEIVAYWNNGELSIGEIRQRLLESAKGEYVCFIDDDDKVPDYYLAVLLGNLGKDYVGFEVELFNKGRRMPRVFHSIRYTNWHQDDDGYYRGVTHLNPIRRELALLGDFGLEGSGEDQSWSIAVTPHVKTENYIELVMYRYMHDSEESSFGPTKHPPGQYTRPALKHPKFRYHPNSKLKGST